MNEATVYVSIIFSWTNLWAFIILMVPMFNDDCNSFSHPTCLLQCHFATPFAKKWSPSPSSPRVQAGFVTSWGTESTTEARPCHFRTVPSKGLAASASSVGKAAPRCKGAQAETPCGEQEAAGGRPGASSWMKPSWTFQLRAAVDRL